MKPIQINEAAERDAKEAIDWYLEHAGRETADRFVDAFQTGIQGIQDDLPDYFPRIREIH